MKIYFALLAIIFPIAIFLNCCSKKQITGKLPPFEMSATITSQGGSTSFFAYGPSSVTAVDSDGECQIFAIDTSGTMIVSKLTFTLFNYRGIGKYIFDSSDISFADYEISRPSFAQTSFAHCAFNITSASGEYVSGTFEGILSDGSVVSNGTFTAFPKGFK